MTILELTSELQANTTKTKLVYDFKSKFVQISDWAGVVVWSGSIKDLGSDELVYEIIPTLLEGE